MSFFKKFLCWTCVLIGVVFFAGCKKQVTTLVEKPKPVVKVDTDFTEPAPFTDIDTSDEASFREAELEAAFRRLVDEKLAPVFFELNSYSLNQESTERLSEAAKFLMEHANIRILIEGHCDMRGSAEYNMGLGENRARAIKNYLMNYGLPSLQFEITSWGKERLAESGCMNEECHQLNRRAGFKVLAR